ncbi:MAG TPA: ABC transporter substrate-binding protein [Pseudonocardiaceae bacterium]|jgi:peptide/nickel transport system substrate-binding protein
MKRRNTVAFAAICAGLSLLTACGSSGSGSSSSTSGTAAAQNAGLTSIVNPSTHKGGTLNLALTNTGDSTDPGNTYYAFNWDFSRLYARPLLTYKAAPGNAGLDLVPDLATGLGKVSDNGLTWTYTIHSGLKFENGEPITTKDVKYAIERSTSYAPDVLPNGPTYFKQYLADPSYPGAYKDKTPGKQGLTSIDTPNDTTIVFHLSQPFAEFDYLATLPQTAPVPVDKDTGANYQTHPISSGPYMFSSFNPNTGFSLVKNPNWSASTDSFTKQNADKINVTYNVEAADIDSRLLNGSLDIDLDGTGVQTAARAKILNSKSLQKLSDDPVTGFLTYAALNTQVAPLNNVDCRKAIEYAVDHVTQQTAEGGPIAGGDIATTMLTPNDTGYVKSDIYNFLGKPHGDQALAKQELQKCGKPNGFSVNMSVRGDRPKEVATGQGIQEALSQVGIKVQIDQFQSGQYYTNFAGSPAYVHSHDLGIIAGGWGADWPSGFGFLSQVVDGRTIKPAGNTNLQETNDPQINAMLDSAAKNQDANARNAIYTQIDQKIMSQAEILPEVYAKALLYRNPKVTNVYVTKAYGMYDYTQMGLSS